MDAYDVMNEWDRVTGKGPRSKEELDQEVPLVISGDYEEWKSRIEARDKKAIVEGMKAWGLPVAPLEPFELDSRIQTAERPFSPDGRQPDAE